MSILDRAFRFPAVLFLAIQAQSQTYVFGKADFAVGDYPMAVANGDFNGDGLTDLVVINSGDSTVSVLLRRPDSTFAPQVTYGTGLGAAVTRIDVCGTLLLLSWASILGASSWFWLRNQRWKRFAIRSLLTLVLALTNGCGGGSSTHTTPGTPVGTYTATLVGTSGNLSHNVGLVAVVK